MIYYFIIPNRRRKCKPFIIIFPYTIIVVYGMIIIDAILQCILPFWRGSPSQTFKNSELFLMTEQEKERQSVHKTFKGEIKKIKELKGFSAKVGYIFDYYTAHIIFIVVTIVVIVSLILHYKNRKDDVLFGVVLNLSCDNVDSFSTNLDEFIGVGAKERTFMEKGLFMGQYSNEVEQKLVMYIVAHQLDYVITDEAGLTHFGNQHFWKDLRELLPADLYEYFKDDIIIRTFTKTDEDTGESVAKEQTLLRINDYQISKVLELVGYDDVSSLYIGSYLFPPHEENVIKLFEYIRSLGKCVNGDGSN